MYKQIVINAAEHETRVALLEDGTISELFIERKDGTDSAGNIYKGKVQRVLPGMQAAFVDIGLSQAAFIYVDDVIGERIEDVERYFNEKMKLAEINPEEGEESEENETGVQKDDFLVKQNIEGLITEGQEMLVQVAKSPMETKGARITSHVSLPGRFLVLMPTSDHIGISRKIEDPEERDRLREIVASLRTDGLGYIVRTAAEGVRQEKIAYEMGYITKDQLLVLAEPLKKNNYGQYLIERANEI